MIKKELVQGTQEWLDLRKTRVTGTDAGVIMRLSPYKTPYVLWQQKLGLLPPDEENEKMREGSRLEKEAVELHEKLTGISTFPNVVLKDSWAMASLDGIDFDGKMILEVKCGVKSYEQALNGEIPDYYMAQMQHNMFVSGAESCDYFCYRPDKEPLGIRVLRDDAFIADMIALELGFHHCLEEKIAPAKALKDVDYISDPCHPFCILEREWRGAKENLNHWKDQEEFLRKQLIDFAPDNAVQGLIAKVTPYKKVGSVNYKKVPQLAGVDLDSYRGKETLAYRVGEVKL